VRDNTLYFIIAFLVAIVSLLFPSLVSLLFLWNIGELYPLDQILLLQQKEFCLYGVALDQPISIYKRKLLVQSNAEIIAIGSSRVMALRQTLFNVSFVNLGGIAGSVNQFEEAVDDVLKHHQRPKVVVVGIDFWWLNDKAPAYAWANTIEKEKSGLAFSSVLMPYKWIINKKNHTKYFLDHLFNDGNMNCRIGLMAHVFDEGFGPDGSYFYNVDGRIDRRDSPNNRIEMIREGQGRFTHTDCISNTFGRKLIVSVNKLRKAGIRTVVIIPPVMQAVNDLMLKERAAYPHFFGIRDYFMKNGIKVYDFSDPSKLGSTDCEFVDGTHGGDILYARMIQAMDHEFSDGMINKSAIYNMINVYAGHAQAPDPRLSSQAEVDFLRLGCMKQ